MKRVILICLLQIVLVLGAVYLFVLHLFGKEIAPEPADSLPVWVQNFGEWLFKKVDE